MLYISDLQITNFRCFYSKKIKFGKNINVLIGSNGIGKTSVAEAIGYISIGKSFRNAKDVDVLKIGEEYFSIVYNTIDEGKHNRIVIYYDKSGKKITKNDKLYNKMSEFFAETGIISFSPDDMKIIKGSPLDRRKYFDLCICQLSKDYLSSINFYNKFLKERNELLKKDELSENDMLLMDLIDEQLVLFGKKIINARKEYIKKIGNNVNSYLSKLSNKEDSISIDYLPKVVADDLEIEIKNRRKHDIYMGTTTCGPHRDEFIIKINEKVADATASQGQIRSAIISLKFSFYESLKAINKNTIIIMDDVLSELDIDRQTQIFNLIDDEVQIFITCTNVNNIDKEILSNSNIIAIGKE